MPILVTPRDCFAPGSAVAIGPAEDPIEGEVLKVCLEFGNTTYEVAWWSGRDRKTAWLQESELRPAKQSAWHNVGFHAD